MDRSQQHLPPPRSPPDSRIISQSSRISSLKRLLPRSIPSSTTPSRPRDTRTSSNSKKKLSPSPPTRTRPISTSSKRSITTPLQSRSLSRPRKCVTIRSTSSPWGSISPSEARRSTRILSRRLLVRSSSIFIFRLTRLPASVEHLILHEAHRLTRQSRKRICKNPS